MKLKSFLFKCFCCISAITFSTATNNTLSVIRNQNNSYEVLNNPTQYIGYGYNVASGKAISEIDSLNLNSPILDVNNASTFNKVKIFTGAKTSYTSNSSKKVSDISESYGSRLSGGIDGQIKCISLDVGAKFNLNKSWSKNLTQSEEYSYYSIYVNNRTVVIQNSLNELRSMLDSNFKEDLYYVKNEIDAQNLFSKYGTHLLTGYTLGGIFEMTNYYAAKSSSYIRETSTSFDAQVNLGLSAVSANADFSFSNNFGTKDNNENAVNNYKCNTYGGHAFPGLTIDQAFSWYETFGSAGYVYDIWTNSINNGDNLVIVDIPQSSKMIPLWDLLPATKEYTTARQTLLEYYISMCGGAYKDYITLYKDIFSNDHNKDSVEETTSNFSEKGFSVFIENSPSQIDYNNKTIDENLISKNGSNYYMSTSTNKKEYNVPANSIVSIDYNISSNKDYDLTWSLNTDNNDILNSNAKVALIDNKNGVVSIGPNSKKNSQFTLYAKLNGDIVYSKLFKVSDENYLDEDGSNTNPYLISNESQFLNFAKTKFNKDTKGKHYKLIADLDFKNLNFEPVGYSNNNDEVAFNGFFDGGNHVIKNIHLSQETLDNYSQSDNGLGLFVKNIGEISNIILTNDDDMSETLNFTNSLSSTLSNAKDSMNDIRESKKQISYIGGIAAQNYTSGSIINCEVNNFKIYNLISEKDIESNVNVSEGEIKLNLGGITAANKGTISKCRVINSSIIAQTHNRSINEVYVGGIAGINKKEIKEDSGTIELSLSKKNYIANICGASKDTNQIKQINDIYKKANDSTKTRKYQTGGIVGYSEKGAIKSSVVSNYNNIDTKIITINASFKTQNESQQIYTNTGGIAGYLDQETIINTCISYNIDDAYLICSNAYSNYNWANYKNKETIKDNENITNDNIKPNLFGTMSKGLFCGTIQETDNISNCLCLSNNLILFHLTDKEGKISITNKTITNNSIIKDFSNCVSKNNNKSLPTNEEFINQISNFDSNFWNISTSSSNPSIEPIFYAINSSDISLSIENAKTEFYINDHFSTGNLKITATKNVDNQTESFDVLLYNVDYSNFDSSMIGTYTIKVSCYNVDLEYNVNVIRPKINSIYVSKKPQSKFFANDKFDDSLLDDLEVSYYSNNGVSNKINRDELVIKHDDIISKGDNEITITYKNLMISYYVTGEEKIVSSVDVDSSNLTNKRYSVGSKEINTKGLKVIVKYSNTDKSDVFLNGENCDLVYSTIAVGENQVIVNYDGYNNTTSNNELASFTVIGEYSYREDLDSDFKKAVENVSSENNLVLKYKLIKKALLLLDEYGDCTSDTKEQNKIILDNEISEFNNLVNSINDDYATSMKIATNYTYSIVAQYGISSIAAIIAIIIKKFC